MAERLMIFNKSKLGHSLSQISELTGLTIEEVKETLGQASGLSPKEVGIIFDMTQRGLSLEQINQETSVKVEVLKQFLPEVTVGTHILADSSPLTTTEYSTEPYKPQPTETLPEPQHSHTSTILYSCQQDTPKLHRVNLLTGEQSCHKVPNYLFNPGCRGSVLPGGSLLITGGYDSREVVKIDTLRECAVSSQPPMHTPRASHVAMYHSQYLYVLGPKECERFVCPMSQWEVLPALPVAGGAMSAVELENSLYALGGFYVRLLDTVQKLSLDSLTWELMQLKLPQASYSIPCFKKDDEVYLVIGETLYSFTPFEVKQIKPLSESIRCYTSYYSRGTLYYEAGGIKSLAVGELTSL
jgi:hypothetical protein